MPPVPAPVPPDGVAPPLVPVPGLVGAGALVPVPAPAPLVPVPALALLAALVVVLVVEELREELVGAATLGPAVGTVNGGAPAVSVVPEPPPPHAARQSVVISAPTVAAGRSLLAPGFTAALRSRAAPCACRSAGSR